MATKLYKVLILIQVFSLVFVSRAQDANTNVDNPADGAEGNDGLVTNAETSTPANKKMNTRLRGQSNDKRLKANANKIKNSQKLAGKRKPINKKTPN